MAIEIDVRINNIRQCGDDLTKLGERIRNYEFGAKVIKSQGFVAAKTKELVESLKSVVNCLADLVEKSAQTTYTAANTFYEMDEGIKY